MTVPFRRGAGEVQQKRGSSTAAESLPVKPCDLPHSDPPSQLNSPAPPFTHLRFYTQHYMHFHSKERFSFDQDILVLVSSIISKTPMAILLKCVSWVWHHIILVHSPHSIKPISCGFVDHFLKLVWYCTSENMHLLNCSNILSNMHLIFKLSNKRILCSVSL